MFVRIVVGTPPSLVDLPTGAGKTDVIVTWLIALAWYAKHRDTVKPVPRRLVWVVNRRVLVQQVFAVAEKLQQALKVSSGSAGELVDTLRALCGQNSASVFNVVQLRGQRLDDREWALNPTMPQLIIGTVDQIGSRLLFQGYGQGKWARPMHASLFGVDAWICIDEAHLVPAFAVTLRQVREMTSHQINGAVPTVITQFFTRLPLWITELSATPGLPAPLAGDAFRLEKEKGDYKDRTIIARLRAKKTRRVLWKSQADKNQIARDMAVEALEIAKRQPGSAIAVFCCTAKDAEAIAKELKKEHPDRVLLVTGRIRGYERDRLERNALFKRFRQSHLEAAAAGEPPAFLVGTAAAEVGLDADASAIVCDFASLPTLAQRLGRLDRRGQLSQHTNKTNTEPPTMTIIGGSDGKTAPAQLEALVKKLNSTSASNGSEFRSEFFTGAPWSVVVGKETTEDKEEDEEDNRPKQPHVLDEDDIIHFEGLRHKILKSEDNISKWIREMCGETVVREIGECDSSEKLLDMLNTLINQRSIYDAARFSAVTLRDKTTKLRDKNPSGKSLRKLNRWLLEDAFPEEIATGAKFGKDDAIDAATWRIMSLPSTVLEEPGDDADAEVNDDFPPEADSKAANAAHETSQPATWLTHKFAAITSGPVVVPPLTESILRRWAATTPPPPRFLPVHPWLYGLLPDDEGTPLVGIAFRLELDVLRFHSADKEEDEDNAAYDRAWQKVNRSLAAFPPLNSELHFVPLKDARSWLEDLPADGPDFAIAHFDGDEWTDSITPEDLSAKSVLVLPTSTTLELLKDIIPPGADETPEQRCWDVFDALAQDGAKYRREVKIIAGASSLRAGKPEDRGVYRVGETGGNTESIESEEMAEEAAEILAPSEWDSSQWKAAGIKLSFSHHGIAFELRYFKPDRGTDDVIDFLPDHLSAAAKYGRQLAEALAPGDVVLAKLLGHAGQQHDIGKDYPKWQQAMGNTPAWREREGYDDDLRIAKPVIENPGNAGGYRHEWGTLWATRADTTAIDEGVDADTAAFLRDIHLHVIAAHHGYFRPSMPDRGFSDKPTTTKQTPLRLEAIERAARLQRQLGCWRLAYLETLIKAADVSASKGAESTTTEDTIDED